MIPPENRRREDVEATERRVRAEDAIAKICSTVERIEARFDKLPCEPRGKEISEIQNQLGIIHSVGKWCAGIASVIVVAVILAITRFLTGHGGRQENILRSVAG